MIEFPRTRMHWSLGILVALGIAWIAPKVHAADLGGDCCADLEERIAELEATTVRAGNRKLKVSLSGHVNESLLYWDNGGDSDVYQVGNIYSSTRARIRATGRINSDLTAGMLIEFEFVNASSAGVSEENDDTNGAIGIRKTDWFIKSATFGKVTVGQSSLTTDDIILINTGGTGEFATSDTPLIVGNFNVFSSTGFLNTQYDQVLGGAGISLAPGATGVLGAGQIPLDTARSNIVRYDTPTFAGFSAAVAWGEDDVWDVSTYYDGGFGDIKLKGGIGYLKNDDPNDSGLGPGTFEELKGSGTILHDPTGLYLHGAFVHRKLDGIGFADVNGSDRPDFSTFYLQSGIRTALNSLGKTTLFGEYGESHDGVTGLADPGAGIARITSSEGQIWGLGIEQDLDAVGMELYLTYRNVDVDISGTVVGGGAVAIDDDNLDLILTGARIFF